MKLIIDEANIEEIKKIMEFYPCDGVTTNPSILAREGGNPIELLKEIRDYLPADKLLFVQAVSFSSEQIVQEAREIVSLLGKDTIIKVPVTEEGIRAIRKLKEEGIKTCGTVVYTTIQGYLAAKSGASYVAPYINRIDNMGYNGVDVARTIQDILDDNDFECELLAASFKNSYQVMQLSEYNIDCVTCSGEIIRNMLKNKAVDGAVNDFVNDFYRVSGGKNMKELIEEYRKKR